DGLTGTSAANMRPNLCCSCQIQTTRSSNNAARRLRKTRRFLHILLKRGHERFWLLFPVFALNVCAQDSAAAGWLLDLIWFDEIATKIFWLKTAANMSGSIAAGVSLLILCPPFVAICQSGGQGVNLQVRPA